MRILIGTLYPNLGGSNRVLLAAARALERDHEVIVRAPFPQATHPAPADVSPEPLAGLPAKLRALPRLAAVTLRELAFARRVRPDVLYVHDDLALYVYGAVARLLRRPLVWHVHMTAGEGLTARARRPFWDRRVFISRFAAEAAGAGPDAVVIRNPLLSVPPPPAARAGADPALTVIGAISRRKNQALAIEALARLRARGRDAALTLVGPEIDPAYGRALRARAAALGVADRVRFVGERTPEEAWREDAIVLSPSTYENQPLVLLEALAGGRRIVASDIAAHREIVGDVGADPACLAALDADAFADAVEAAALRPPDPAVAARVRDLFAPERFEGGIRALFRNPVRG